MSPPLVIRPQVVALHRNGYTPREIAKTLGISLETTYSHIKLARLAGELPQTGMKRAGPYKTLPPLPDEPQPERCPRCHLALPHVCMGTIDDFARQQSRNVE